MRPEGSRLRGSTGKTGAPNLINERARDQPLWRIDPPPDTGRRCRLALGKRTSLVVRGQD
jgi:hypothetical protein